MLEKQQLTLLFFVCLGNYGVFEIRTRFCFMPICRSYRYYKHREVFFKLGPMIKLVL
jgi:hypothetical protein